MRSSECGMSWRTPSLGLCYWARPSTAIPHSTLRIPHGSPPHRSVLTNAPTPREAVRQDPNGEPDDLPAEPTQDGVPALPRAGEEIDGKGEHGAEPQHPSGARDGGRQQGEWGDPPRQEQGHPGVQLHDRRGARRPERQQSRREADEEPHRGREQHRYGCDRPPAGVERQSHGGPRRGHQQPDHEDDARRARLVRDVLRHGLVGGVQRPGEPVVEVAFADPDRKSTRLNSSHLVISYAVFCLKKKAALYHGALPGARPFLYPPFAAMVFQLFALLPLPVAAEILSFVSLALLSVTTYLTQRIVSRTYPDRATGPLPLVLAVVLTLVFFLDNFNRVQINEVIFLLILLGIDAHLRSRDVRSAAYFVVATALKITPVFFVIWLMLRGRRRAALAVPPLAIACVVAPLLMRGPATGAAELAEYYHSFLQGFQHGQGLTDQRE